MTAPTTDLDREAVRAAWTALPLDAPPALADVASALAAARRVYDAADEAYVQRQVAEAKLAGMNITEHGAEIQLVMAQETAAHLVQAARTYLDSTGAENYVEQTVTDRDTGERYTITFQRPGGKSAHELRRQAEADRDEMLAHYSAALDEVYRLRCALAFEARVTEAHLDLAGFPRSRRHVAEEQVQRMRAAVREGAPARYAGASTGVLAGLLADAGASMTLTRAQWEAR